MKTILLGLAAIWLAFDSSVLARADPAPGIPRAVSITECGATAGHGSAALGVAHAAATFVGANEQFSSSAQWRDNKLRLTIAAIDNPSASTTFEYSSSDEPVVSTACRGDTITIRTNRYVDIVSFCGSVIQRERAGAAGPTSGGGASKCPPRELVRGLSTSSWGSSPS